MNKRGNIQKVSTYQFSKLTRTSSHHFGPLAIGCTKDQRIAVQHITVATFQLNFVSNGKLGLIHMIHVHVHRFGRFAKYFCNKKKPMNFTAENLKF